MTAAAPPALSAPGGAAAASWPAPVRKPHLPPARIIQMNLGFLGLQFSFGLQQGNMGPILSYLGAHEDRLALLQLAGPMTGLIVQPIIGALSDRTLSRFGRRTPYFVTGALMCAAGLLFMPFSSSVAMAVALLWLLDAGNNITMEPYRAYVADRLNEDQLRLGFLSQSAFTGLAQMLAFLTPTVLVVWLGVSKDAVDAHGIPDTVHIVFLVGAALSLATILFSILSVPELPLAPAEITRIRSEPGGIAATFAEIWSAIREMPRAMRKLALMSLFQWYGMYIYFTYAVYSVARSIYGASGADAGGLHSAVLTNGRLAAGYNAIACLAAFAMVPLARRFGAARVHAVCLAAGGIAMIGLPRVGQAEWLALPAIGMGLAWGSIMGNPYIILSDAIPPERNGVYMGIFNMMIVIPMLLAGLTLPLIYGPWLGGDARGALVLGGAAMLCAAAAVLRARGETALA